MTPLTHDGGGDTENVGGRIEAERVVCGELRVRVAKGCERERERAERERDTEREIERERQKSKRENQKERKWRR